MRSNMLRTFASMTLLACALASAGCSAAEDAATDSLDTIHNSKTLNGTWKGNDGSTGPATAVFEQRGLNVSATLVLTGHRCVDRMQLAAGLDSDGFSGKADIGAMHVTYSGKADLSELLADFEALSDGPCPGEKGNVQLKL
jgi:hypothetical protein